VINDKKFKLFSYFGMNREISRGGYLSCFCGEQEKNGVSLTESMVPHGLIYEPSGGTFSTCKQWHDKTNIAGYNTLIESTSVFILLVQLINK